MTIREAVELILQASAHSVGQDDERGSHIRFGHGQADPDHGRGASDDPAVWP